MGDQGRERRGGGFVRGLLLLLAGALLGANVVYYLLRGQATECATPATPAAAATVPPAAQPAAPRRPPPPSAAPAAPSGEDRPAIPVAGVTPSQLVDTYTQSRGSGRLHDAIDIMAAAGTPVLAAVDGPVAKLFTSDAGGLTLYQFDRAGTYVYYYAHLQGYAPGIAEGQVLARGQVLGYVGSTGNADPEAPHLHFGISRLDAERNWHGGTPVNPFPLLTGRPEAAGSTPAR